MWDCSCGCKSIAGSLTSCPMCFKEREMPRSVAGAQPSNENARPGEAGHVAPEAAGESAVTPEAPQEASGATQEPQEAVGDPSTADDGQEAAQEAPRDVLSDLEAAAAALRRPEGPVT